MRRGRREEGMGGERRKKEGEGGEGRGLRRGPLRILAGGPECEVTPLLSAVSFNSAIRRERNVLLLVKISAYPTCIRRPVRGFPS